jgi:precorrin-6Y C5,15-methyltransferase (decarboxylating)
MNNILLFAGTTEGRSIAEALNGQQQVFVTVSVATEYGETLIAPGENVRVVFGRKNEAEIEALVSETQAELLIDATHPYAKEITKTLKAVAEATRTDYLRVVRASEAADADGCTFVDDTEAAVAYLSGTQGNVLLTVGSKELAAYTAIDGYAERLFARILPVKESADAAFALGFSGKNLICMQGPFSEELNAALLKSIDAKFLVTKDTGAAGGFSEKIRAAKALGVTPVVIRRPGEEEGVSLTACLALLSSRFGIVPKKEITILGVGTGSGQLTQAAIDAVKNAELVIGAKRVTDALKGFHKPVEHAIASDRIESIIRESAARRIVVAMSGDTGFYSGTKALLERIADLNPAVLPGISSVAYFAAKLRTAWDDALLCSVHGRSANFIAKIKTHPKVFLLTGGEWDVRAVLDALNAYGLSNVRAAVGENLSYENERITRGTAAELASMTFDQLSVMLIENPDAAFAVITHGRSDEDFLRTEVPMTKSEVRAVTLSKLKLTRDAVCWDVGAGTGSVSLEMAEAAEDGFVYAVEQKPEACALIEQNRRRLGIMNVAVVEGTAPEALSELPKPTHVFIGGSGGSLREIMEAAIAKNPAVRIVLNTVTAETFAEALTVIKALPLKDAEIAELNVSRARKAGRYHLMTAQNPVYIISCEGENADA